ncbi:MAG: signal peptidase II [Firmicutes bacterium]|nr:signal peptidase II [Bacillota bacterium]
MKRKSLIIGLVIVFIDQLMKLSIDNSLLLNETIVIIKDFFYITKVYNYGASWSMFSGMLNFLIGITILSFICLVYYQESFKKNARNVIGFGLIYGGLFGNLIDRLNRGYVIDFFHIQFGNYTYPIFNYADIALVIGFFLLIYSLFKGDDTYKNNSRKRKYKN